MSSKTEALAQIDEFSKTWDYDASYLAELLESSEGAFQAFAAAQGMSYFRGNLAPEVHAVATIAAMQGQDCGPCTKLNFKMAAESGVDREILRKLYEAPEELPQTLADVREHAYSVSTGRSADPARVQRLKETYGAEGFAEIAVAIVGATIYPTMKRSLFRDEACELSGFEF